MAKASKEMTIAVGSEVPVIVAVDFTSGRGDVVRTRLENAAKTVATGDVVLAVDADDDLAADGIVEDVRDGFIFIRIAWDTQRDAARKSSAGLTLGGRLNVAFRDSSTNKGGALDGVERDPTPS